jgi:hypothetical protein
MKRVIYKLTIAFIIVAGLCIGVVKGQDARSKWVSKMKSKQDQKKVKLAAHPDEIILDDFEWQTFHRN